MRAQQNKEVILKQNNILIDKAVLSACIGHVRADLEQYLLLVSMEGRKQLVDAVRLTIQGERKLVNFSHLDQEDTVVIEKILELIATPDVFAANLLLSAQKQLNHSVSAAHTLVKAAIDLQPENPMVYAIQGQAYFSEKLLNEAERSFRKSLKLSPNQPLVLLQLGIVLNDLKRSEEAINAFEDILKYQPYNLDALTHLAYLYELSYRLDEAEDRVAKGLSINPEHAILVFMQGKLLQRAGKLEQAIRSYHHSLELKLSDLFSGDAYSRLGYLYDQTGNIQNSIECFTQANKIYEETCKQTGVDKNTFLNDVDHVENIEINLSYDTDEVIDEYKDPVFLVGFPRSGTTLLNQILDSHNDIQTVEEGLSASNMIKMAISGIRNA